MEELVVDSELKERIEYESYKKSINEKWNCTTELLVRYKKFCKLVVDDSVLPPPWNDFKNITPPNDWVYSHIVGCDLHGEETGLMFLNWIKEKYPHLQNHFDKFRENDKIGNPPIYTYDGEENFSPNTLRYIRVFGEIQEHFGSLDNKNIIEIGPGYGGLCKIISCVDKFNSYSFVDCPEAIGVCKRYMNEMEIKNTMFYADDVPPNKEYDLVIADSSLSEMSAFGFDYYLENILMKSKNAYLAMNDYYRKEETIEKINKAFPKVSVLPDKPSMNEDNECYILICKR